MLTKYSFHKPCIGVVQFRTTTHQFIYVIHVSQNGLRISYYEKTTLLRFFGALTLKICPNIFGRCESSLKSVVHIYANEIEKKIIYGIVRPPSESLQNE